MTASKVEANQRNASLSTGPRTPERKAASSMNALRHGLTAQGAILPGEDEGAFQGLRQRLEADLAPVGPIEELLVGRIAVCAWRLERAGRLESQILYLGALSAGIADASRDIARAETNEMQEAFPQRVTDQVGHAEAERRREALEGQMAGVALGRSFVGDAGSCQAIDKLMRYESTIGRTLFRSLDELRRLQASRYGASKTA